MAAPDIKMPLKSSLDGSKFDGSGYDLRAEILAYRELELEIQERWASELAQIA